MKPESTTEEFFRLLRTRDDFIPYPCGCRSFIGPAAKDGTRLACPACNKKIAVLVVDGVKKAILVGIS